MSGIIGVSPDMRSGVVGKYPTGSIIKTDYLGTPGVNAGGTGYIWSDDTNKYVSTGTRGPFTAPFTGAKEAHITFTYESLTYNNDSGNVDTNQRITNRFYFKTASVGAGTEWSSWDAAFGTQFGGDSVIGIRHVSEYDGWMCFPTLSATFNLPIDATYLSAGSDYYYHMGTYNFGSGGNNPMGMTTLHAVNVTYIAS